MRLAINDENKLRLFQVIGAVTFMIGIAAVVLYLDNASERLRGGRDLSPALWLGLFGISVGVCTALLARWAVFLASLCYAIIGGGLIIDSLLHTPFPWTLMNVALGVAALIPMLLLVRAITINEN